MTQRYLGGSVLPPYVDRNEAERVHSPEWIAQRDARLAALAEKQAKGAPASGRRSSRPARAAGATCPPALTGGESGGAKVDWLTVTWLPEPDEHVPAMVLDLLNQWTGLRVQGVDCPGMLGYQHGVRYFVKLDDGADHHVARVDFGGTHHQLRARLDLSGSCASRVRSWAAVQGWIAGLFDPKITRVDLAVDCLQGEYTVDDAAEWYKAGLFNAGGRMPRHSCPGDWLSDQPKNGRTLEVGRRENGKMLRAYEKGRQLGDPDSMWTRFEVEIRNRDRDIPLDVLTRRDEYFVGAYKCLQTILDAAAERIATHQTEGEITVERVTECCRVQYGQTINVLRATLTAEEIIESLSRPGVPKRLQKASLGGFHHKAPSAVGVHHEDASSRV